MERNRRTDTHTSTQHNSENKRNYYFWNSGGIRIIRRFRQVVAYKSQLSMLCSGISKCAQASQRLCRKLHIRHSTAKDLVKLGKEVTSNLCLYASLILFKYCALYKNYEISYRRHHVSLLVLVLLLHMHQTQTPLCGCSHLTAQQTCLASLEPGTTSEYQQKMHP